ncbi:endoribonuclease Dicer [Artemisia annua]|uniref:Endoribonuclease Dicer n=1 Tax=Artemisia annua TaxID=35608 RepID=A0A2U1LKN0_ARTAN|nr:endoribonuclease Dicer [Artemisia annua]
MGALSDRLLPHNEDLSETKSSKNKEALSGTTKRKELHENTPIHVILSTWGEKLADGVKFYAYKMSFTCSNDDHIYSSFVLLLESKLEDDMANFKLDLYGVKRSLSSCPDLLIPVFDGVFPRVLLEQVAGEVSKV